jgi:signal transduction histidine kinase
VLSKDHHQVLAVRYALQPNISYTNSHGRLNVALQIRISNVDIAMDQYQHWITGTLTSIIFRIGALIILAVIHLAYYIYYPPKKANLYLFLFAIFMLAGQLSETNVSNKVEDTYFLNNILLDSVMIGGYFMLTALYALLELQKKWEYWTLFSLLVLSIFLNALNKGWVSIVIICSIGAIEIVHMAFKSVKSGRRGGWIITAGAINTLIFWAIYLLGIPFHYMSYLIGRTYTIGDIAFNLAFFSIPIATSIYLGLEFAFINRSLTQKIVEVELLSVKTVEQEREKQQILLTQKDTLEKQVSERTKELNQSLEDLKATEAQLIQSEKMASLGELTAGIAHEIQNPLNFVNNFSEVNKELIEEMKKEMDGGNVAEAKKIAIELEHIMEKINHHGKRADAIVKGMLEHSRISTGQKELTDINALAAEFLRICYNSFCTKDKSFNATIRTDFAPHLVKLNVIPQDIGRVFLNLFNNAFYSLAEKKKMQNQEYEAIISVTTKEIDHRLEISVKDNGTGIPENIRQKIFQPFFTTKPAGQGTGLGLSMSYDIVNAYGGQIRVESEEGMGTEFIVELP